MRSLTRLERGIVLTAAASLWMLTGTPMLGLISLGCIYRMFTRDWQNEPDREGLVQYVGLLAAFAIISALTATPAAVPAG
jgi:hypothetical protein